MNWRKRVVEISDREKLVQLIESGDKLISNAAKLTGISGRYELVMNLIESQKAYKEQLAEMDRISCR